MSALVTSADGANVFAALEDGSGYPVIATAARTDLSTWSGAYEPGAGSAANIAAVASNPDKVIFYGNFGTDVTVIMHTISTATNTDISPASLGAKVINALHVNPSDENEMIATVDTDEDLIHTTDGGTTWSTLDAALGFDATALWVMWSGAYYPHRLFVAGHNGTDLDVLYSPNAGSSNENKEDATLGGKANITNIEATEA